MIENCRVDINTFSKNNLTNIGKYDIYGNLLSIDFISVQPQSKHYQQVQMIDNAPHQVRKKSNRKKKQQEILYKKSQREVLQQFQILSGLFTVDHGSQNDLEILQSINFNDNSYNQLWDKIVGDIDIKNKDNIHRKNINWNMDDGEIDSAIRRVVQEAIQYQLEVLDQEIDQQQQQQNQQIPIIQEIPAIVQPKKQDQKKFETIRIQRKQQYAKNTAYQYALQDQSDITNFYDQLPKQKFATSYPFQLDQFQKRSILHLERKESVFVAAHTSAGKTVIAQYGIALAIKHKRKVIYTSPIKALSNQKYRQLNHKFGCVGIVTGDVSLNQSATCVIMTTQILRNNLYKGSQMIRDIEWVIFDEIHYINNAERGVVWEETIIMLPEHIGLIMLSATVPNYMEFANWVGRTKRRMIYVMKTFHRPVPLQHSLYLFDKFHVIKQASGKFLQQEYNALKNQIVEIANSHLTTKQKLRQDKKKKIQQKGFYNDNRRQQRLKLMNKNAVDKFIKKIQKSDLQTAQGKQQYRLLQSLIMDCHKKNLLPCVVFTFSKKKINSLADKLWPNVLTNSIERYRIIRQISQALSNLKPQDQEIQQFSFLSRICPNGYAVHHGDLLPLAKQIVQLLFSQGLIKVLFATQTFAMGINMPTKTVIFNQIKKVYGSQGQLRFLNSSEYVQMSGRAGRRGLDQKGTVIIMVKNPNTLPETDHMIKMIDHPGEQLRSKFKISYQIILNLYTSKDVGVKDMMRNSFLQNSKFSQLKANIRKFQELTKNYKELSQIDCPYNKLGTRNLIEEYMNYSNQIRTSNQSIFQVLLDNRKLSFPKLGLILGHNNEMQLCLILRINNDHYNKGIQRYVQILIVKEIDLGLYLTTEQMIQENKKKNKPKRIVLQYDKKGLQERNQTGQVPGTKNQYHYYAYWVSPSQILKIYTLKVTKNKQMDFSRQDFQQLSKQLLDIMMKKKELAEINYPQIQQVAVKDSSFKQFMHMPCHQCELKQKHRNQHNQKINVKKLMFSGIKNIDTNQLETMGSFQGMVKLLKKFNFLHDDTLTLKGRVARELDIYVTQVIVEAVLDPLDYCELAALLSAFVCDYKPRPKKNSQKYEAITPFNNNHKYTYRLEVAIDQTYDIIKRISQQQEQSQCYIFTSSYDQLILARINFHLCDTVYKWAQGFDFVDAATDTQAPQGTIVRTILRLNMLMNNIKSVCKILGNSQLQQKIDRASEAIKRDIVFCQSLYLSG